MFDDEYFWTKNGRPDPSKDKDANMASRHIVNNLKREGFVLKSYREDLGEGPLTTELDRTLFHQDLTPFVRYSLNKRRGWEVEAEVDRLGEVQETSDGMKATVVNVNRMRNSHSYSHHLFCYDYYRRLFNLREIHLSMGASRDDASTSSESDSPDEPNVFYHFFTPPKADEKFLKRFYCYEDSKEWHKIVGHGMRKKKNETMKALINGYSDDFSEEPHLPDETRAHENPIFPRKFYNLEDHIVASSNKSKKKISR